MAIDRISVFLPRKTDFYENLLTQIGRGFESIGVECTGASAHLDGPALRDWCALHRPQAILEMNRPGRDVPHLPKGVRHIVWIVDLGGRSTEYFEGSSISYYFIQTRHYASGSFGLRKWFGPGSCIQDYRPEPTDLTLDASFAGHIPNQWTPAELARPVARGSDALTFAELLQPLTEVANLHKEWRTDPPPAEGDMSRLLDHPGGKLENVLRATASKICLARTGSDLVEDSSIAYDIDGRLIRMLNRSELGNLLADSGCKFRVYGSKSWRRWQRFAPHYRGWLSGPKEMRAAYQRSALNLHEGVGIHFRSLDVMASGGLLFFRRGLLDKHHGGISTLFNEHEHFVPFVPDDFEEKLELYLNDRERAQRVRTRAAQYVAEHHTWKHRALEIVADLNDID